MKKITLSLSLLEEIVAELKAKIINNHFSHISVVNSSDILFNFSFYNKEKLFLSLNHSSPFIALVDRSFTSATTNGGLSENLRKLIKGTYIIDVSVLNSDRVIKFTLCKTNDFFEKETLFLVIELIPTKSNLIVLDDNNKIIYAYHYTDLTHNHPIVKGMKYEVLEGKSLKDLHIDYQEYKDSISHYLVEAENKRKIEAQKPLYNKLVSRRKSLYKKIEVLNTEIETAKEGLIYKEYGEMIFAYLYDKNELDKYIKESIPNIYDGTLSPTENANLMFKKYKKFKRTIEMDELELEKANKEINELTTHINVFNYLDEDEINDLYNQYLPNKGKNKKVKVDAKLPFYVKVKDTIIGFGKNAIQNNYLTFKKAKREHVFLHINEYTGSHVIIFNDKPTNEELLTASEICLILSNQEVGDVKYCPLSEVKKGQSLGMVQVGNYKLITLRSIRNETYNLLKEQKRFTN